MKSILITGASGFVGGHVVDRLSTTEAVTAQYRNRRYAGQFPNGICLDLTRIDELQGLLESLHPNVILHTAAMSNLDQCEKEPDTAHKINVLVPKVLAEYAHSSGNRFIHLSSDMVFDGQKGGYREGDPVAPLSVYGRTKVESEDAVLDGCDHALVVRTALIYGRPALGGQSFSTWIEGRLQNHQTVPLYPDQFRSPIWVETLADLLIELIDRPVYGILHVGSSNRIDRYTFGQQLCRAGGYDSSLLQAVSMYARPVTAPRPQDVSLNTDLAASLLSTPLPDTQTALDQMMASSL